MSCILTDKELQEKCHAAISAISAGRKKWQMSIPAQENDDTDLILSEALRRWEQLESENAELSATIDEIAALNEKENEEAIRLQAELNQREANGIKIGQLENELERYKGALRTLAIWIKKVSDADGCRNCPIIKTADEDGDCDCKRIEKSCENHVIAYALAHPSSLDEISSKDYGADGVGLTHAEVDKLTDGE